MENYIVITMVKRVFVSFNLFLVCLLASLQVTHANNSALNVKGAATYKALGIEYYIASLYIDDTSINSAAIIDYSGSQKIKIKVANRRWSSRKWKAQWQNNIAINNEPSSNQDLNTALALFTEFPKASLVAGDEIIISFQPESGSELTFNGHSVLKTPNKQFYNYILHTWLGKFSPNRIFREKISGAQTPEVKLVETSSMLVDEQRIKAVGKWFLSVEEKNIAKIKKQKAAEALRQQEIKAAKIKQQAIADQKKLKQEKKARLLAEEKKARLAKAMRDQEAQGKLKAKNQAAEKSKQEKKRLALQAAERKKLKALNQQKYLQQLYQWQLRTRVNETVAYPPWAKQFNQQGTVKVNFKVNRSGTLSNLEYLVEDISPILEQEVEKRLQFAVEVIALPKELKGDVWSFSLRYVFDLKLAEQETLLKPLKPL